MTDLLKTVIENREIVQPNHANTLGSAHGGTVMKWMDDVGAMSAMRFAGSHCVTARVDRMNFDRPIPVGRTAFITAYVYDSGRTSVKVWIKTQSEDVLTHEKEQTTESFFTYVAIDEDGVPIEVPKLTVDSNRGQRLRAQALENEDEQSR